MSKVADVLTDYAAYLFAITRDTSKPLEANFNKPILRASIKFTNTIVKG